MTIPGEPARAIGVVRLHDRVAELVADARMFSGKSPLVEVSWTVNDAGHHYAVSVAGVVAARGFGATPDMAARKCLEDLGTGLELRPAAAE